MGGVAAAGYKLCAAVTSTTRWQVPRENWKTLYSVCVQYIYSVNR